MKLVLAPDSFKESMTAPEAAAAMRRGVHAVLPDAECVEVPVSDGGEGFAVALTAAAHARLVEVPVRDALGRPATAHLGHDPVAAVGIVEVAQAAGLAGIPPAERDVLAASSAGVGDLLRAALDLGCRRIVVGLGGSATNDGGAGMLAALGARFLDAAGRELDPVPARLAELAGADLTGLDPRLRDVTIEAGADVLTPLLGPHGASATFGPQKGASAADVAVLEAGLARLAHVVAVAGGRPSDAAAAPSSAAPAMPSPDARARVADEPRTGAAGGIGWALRAVLGARLLSGVDLVLRATDLAARVAGADYVLTGEGSLDAQTALGKVPLGVARVSAAAGVPAIGFGGRVTADADVLLEHGFLALVPVTPGPCDLATALRDGPVNLERAVATCCRLLRRYPPLPSS